MSNQRPQVGDVVFTSQLGIESKASHLIQYLVDADAKRSTRAFGHAAVVVSDLFAVEAVPSASVTEIAQGGFRLPQAVERGKWSGAELRAGVRIVPIADLIAPSTGATVAVLRSPLWTADGASRIKIFSEFVTYLLGSPYSLDRLIEIAKDTYGDRIVSLTSRRFDWSSAPADLSTHVKLTPELRADLTEALPELVLPAATRSFFCSQLVSHCLKLADLVPVKEVSDIITPTGLYAKLCALEWMDFTETYTAYRQGDRFLGISKTETEIQHLSVTGLIDMARNQAETDLSMNLLRGLLDKANSRLGEILNSSKVNPSS